MYINWSLVMNQRRVELIGFLYEGFERINVNGKCRDFVQYWEFVCMVVGRNQCICKEKKGDKKKMLNFYFFVVNVSWFFFFVF